MSEMLDPIRYRANHAFVVFAIPLLIGCYFLIEHNWEASTRITESTGILYDGGENHTADREETINAGSSSSRVLLAGYALLGLGIPCASRFRPSSPVLWCLLGYLAYMVTTYLWATEPDFTAFKLTVLCVFSFTAFGFSRQMTLGQIGRVFALVCVAFILIGVIAELRFGTFKIVGDYRFTGSKHPNTQAGYGAVACIAATLFYRKEDKSSFVYAVIVFAIGFLCLLLTKSRTSLAAMILGMTAFHAIRFRGMKRLILISTAVFGIAAGSLLLSFVNAQMKGAIGDAAAMGRTDDVGTLSGRLPLWEELLEHVAERPLFGHGYLSMWTIDRVEYLGDMFKWEIPHAHNLYIDILLDGGVIGLTLYVMLMLVGLIESARRFLRTGDDGAAFCFALIFFALVHGTAESYFKQPVFVTLCLITLLCRLTWVGPEDGNAASPSESLSASEAKKTPALISV